MFVLLPLSCVGLLQKWHAHEEAKLAYSVEKETPPDFPVALFWKDPDGTQRVKLVFFRELADELSDRTVSYIAPRDHEDELREQLAKRTRGVTGNPADPRVASFSVEDEGDGKQVLQVSMASGDDGTNTGWYEADSGGIKPLRLARDAGSAMILRVLGKTFVSFVVLFVLILFILQKALQRNKAA